MARPERELHPTSIALGWRGVRGVHFAVVSKRGLLLVPQNRYNFFHARDCGRVHDHAALRMTAQCAQQHFHLRARFALLHHVLQVGTVKAGNIFVGLAHLQLMKNVVPHALRGAGRKGRDGAVGKMRAQRA